MVPPSPDIYERSHSVTFSTLEIPSGRNKNAVPITTEVSRDTTEFLSVCLLNVSLNCGSFLSALVLGVVLSLCSV